MYVTIRKLVLQKTERDLYREIEREGLVWAYNLAYQKLIFLQINCRWIGEKCLYLSALARRPFLSKTHFLYNTFHLIVKEKIKILLDLINWTGNEWIFLNKKNQVRIRPFSPLIHGRFSDTYFKVALRVS